MSIPNDRSALVAAPTASPTTPVFLLVHGAWHGSWCWPALQQELAARGHDSLVVDLPSTQVPAEPGPQLLPDMSDDVDAIRDALHGVERPVVLVAHSYGGIPATVIAATDPRVVALVYVAAYALEPGQSMVTLHGNNPTEDVMLADAGIQDALFTDVTPEQRDWACAQLTPQSVRAFREPLPVRPDPSTPTTTYVITDRDEILPPAFQQTMAAWTDRVRHLDTGHSAWLSAPGALAALLAELTPEAHDTSDTTTQATARVTDTAAAALSV